jgi:hypothetical protein
MQSLFGGKTPARDNSLDSQRAVAEAAAAREKAELTARAEDEKHQRRSGRRGNRQLFSGAGGFLGFPAEGGSGAGQDTLGG